MRRTNKQTVSNVLPTPTYIVRVGVGKMVPVWN